MTRANRRRRIRRLRRRLAAALLPHVAPPLLRFLSRSWKVEIVGQDHWDEAWAAPGMLATLWHGRMVVPITAQAGKGLNVLVSPSADGKLVPPILERFGYRWVHGSTNKNPAKAVREMLERLKAGGRIVITPDGPRGPRHSTNPGPAWMARETGFPILPVGAATDSAWRLSSWDRFTIPKRGARVVVVYAEPLYVPPDAGDAVIDRATEEMRRRMIAAEEEGFRRLGCAVDW
jgi:lysophospholipid acyltransferase (LPLAT)-like uncharacterized protein